MYKVLVVDDSQDIAHLISDVFRNLKLDTTTCFNGDEAIKHISQTQYDLIVTDIIMPEKDGIDVINHVKQNNIKTPIVAITGGGVALSAESAIHALEETADAFLKKPVMRDELLAIARQFIDI